MQPSFTPEKSPDEWGANEQERSEIELRSLRNFWESLGARTALMTAPDHDRLVARISHVPHVLSAVCALVALKNPGDGDYAGQGLRDTSRVGGGDPAMWTEILMENREQIEAPLRECGNILTELADYLVGKGIPFRTAHDISGQVVLLALEQDAPIEDLSLAQLQSLCSDIDEDVYPVLQLEYGVDKRNILGGTSAETVTKALYEELEKLDKLG